MFTGKKQGFTLIELVLVIVILAILAAVAIPKFYDLREQAQEAAKEQLVVTVVTGIHNWHANAIVNDPWGPQWPKSLEISGEDATIFEAVLQHGMQDDEISWELVGGTVIYKDENENVWQYHPSKGEFLRQLTKKN